MILSKHHWINNCCIAGPLSSEAQSFGLSALRFCQCVCERWRPSLLRLSRPWAPPRVGWRGRNRAECAARAWMLGSAGPWMCLRVGVGRWMS